MYAAVTDYAYDLCSVQPDDHPAGNWLTLLGSSDLGKTHMARALAGFWDHELANYNKPISHKERTSGTIAGYRPARIMVWPTLMNKFRDANRSKSDLYAAIREPAFLVVDDIGADQDTDFGKYVLTCCAYERERKPTVWTSNLLLDQISARLDPRLASRMERLGTVFQIQIDTMRHNLRPVPYPTEPQAATMQERTT
jgi:DNA replication protein DnaC